MKKQLIIAATAFAAASAVSSCSCDGGKKDEIISRQAVEENVREFVYPLPTAFEITEMLNRIEAPYIQFICNEKSNVEKYLTEGKRALNMGVYSADLCYASTYNQQQIVMDYFDVIRKLIDDLYMSRAVDPELPSKIEAAENNKDELTKLISESFYDSYDYLNKNDRGPVALLIVAGSWVEGLYITTHISEDTFNNKEMIKIVMSQREPLMQLVKLLEKYTGNESIDSIRTALAPLYEIYNSITDGGISETQIENIKVAVDAVRSDIISY